MSARVSLSTSPTHCGGNPRSSARTTNHAIRKVHAYHLYSIDVDILLTACCRGSRLWCGHKEESSVQIQRSIELTRVIRECGDSFTLEGTLMGGGAPNEVRISLTSEACEHFGLDMPSLPGLPH